MKNFILYLSLLSFASSPSYSQQIQWQNTIGGSFADQLQSIQQTDDGGYILGGNSTSNISGDKTEASNGLTDYWIVKTDASGNIQWQNTIGGSGEDYLREIQQTADGGYILAGDSESDSSGDKTENNMGFLFGDYWIVKTDATGNIQWENTIGGIDRDLLHSIRQTVDGGYILGGYSHSGISGDKTDGGYLGGDYWILKTDSLGNIQWQNAIGGNGVDMLYSIQQTDDGGYILGGHSNSNISGDKTENSQGGSTDYWIVKTDSSGNILWQNTIGGAGNDFLRAIQETDDGGYILGGYSESNLSGDKTENSNGLDDIWIVKTDATGNIEWQNTIGGASEDELFSIDQTIDGGYILGGTSRSNISGDKTENVQVQDYWVVKTDSSGIIQWQNSIGGDQWDYLNAIQQTADGGYILGGHSTSTLSGDKTEDNPGFINYWIVKLNGQSNMISGSVFADLNSNSVQEAGEPDLTNRKLSEQNTGSFTFSGQNGNYYVTVLDSGNFSVMPDPINYYNAMPASHSAYFNGIQQTDSLNDFAFQPQGVMNDLCVSLIPLGPFRDGFDASYMITIENAGTSTISPTIFFFPDDDLTFVSAAPSASAITVDSIAWNFGPMDPFQTSHIYVTMNVSLATTIGTPVNSSVHIEPVAGDANPACNDDSWNDFVSASFDPNDILVSEDTLTTTQVAAQSFLDYTIRFQNTGSDTAFTVKILNPIDTARLELNTIEFVNASHPVQLNWISWERNMEFMFKNILLPDSNINEPLSHGFVSYRIKNKTNLLAGDSICNHAAIYFDFNAPVLTNTAVTKIVLPTGVNEWAAHDTRLVIFPNPATDEITISGYDFTNGQTQLEVLDVLGNEVFTGTVTTATIKLPIRHLAGGVYFVHCGNANSKFVKE